jgi:hypothetical protein
MNHLELLAEMERLLESDSYFVSFESTWEYRKALLGVLRANRNESGNRPTEGEAK